MHDDNTKASDETMRERAKFKPLPFIAVLFPLLYLIDRFFFASQLATLTGTFSAFAIEGVTLLIIGFVWMFIYSILSVILFEKRRRRGDIKRGDTK